VKAMSSMNDDIDTLIANMQTQYKTLRTAYDTSISEIEKAFEDERSQILEANKQEID
jgi:hypothetical protein